jgi:hypothetical protein
LFSLTAQQSCGSNRVSTSFPKDINENSLVVATDHSEDLPILNDNQSEDGGGKDNQAVIEPSVCFEGGAGAAHNNTTGEMH